MSRGREFHCTGHPTAGAAANASNAQGTRARPVTPRARTTRSRSTMVRRGFCAETGRSVRATSAPASPQQVRPACSGVGGGSGRTREVLSSEGKKDRGHAAMGPTEKAFLPQQCTGGGGLRAASVSRWYILRKLPRKSRGEFRGASQGCSGGLGFGGRRVRVKSFHPPDGKRSASGASHDAGETHLPHSAKDDRVVSETEPSRFER